MSVSIPGRHRYPLKWAKMTKVSQDTATRDIKDLIDKDVLRQAESGGRSTHYLLV